jgi:RHS repeat-associated protein
VTNLRAVLIRSAIVAAACSTLLFAYSYYYTDSLTSINTSNWTENGTLTAGTGGLTSSATDGGSLISKVAVPDGTSNYEVKTTLTLTQSGGTYITYLHASSNAMSGPAPTGTTYAFEVQNPTFSGSSCSATLAGYKIINGAVTALAAVTIVCHNGVTIRAVYTSNDTQLVVYVDNVDVWWASDASIASGQPGIGVRGAPSGNSIAQVQLGPRYDGTPVMPPTNEIGVSAFANQVQIQWPGASEIAGGGPGIAVYQMYRNGVFLGRVPNGFVDFTVSPSTSYTYTIYAYDFDLNYNTETITVTTPPTGAIDPREIGVRPTGSYWGGGGEHIDMRSGNLNYTMPILTAMGRGGWSKGFNLTYNSQNWRQDPAGTWQLGQDVGYGYGWKLLAGSLIFLGPSWAGEYLFTDATGAQYHLTQDNGGIWTSIESIYVSYNSNTNVLNFNDGSFWVMGSTSAGTEWDAGTMYPTLMEDSNGNQVFINYGDGVGVTWNDSSSRISSIEDVRGNGAPDYTFTYNSDAIPHLTLITNNIGTSENYSFAYNENYALNSPFNQANFSTVALLESSTVTGVPLTTYFTYDTTSATTSCGSTGTGASGPGQLSQVTTPYCGHLRWTYAPYTLSGSRTYYEVQNRYLSMSSGAAETMIQLVRGNDSAYTVHSSATLEDSVSNAEKYWTFETTAGFNLGLQLSYEELTLSTGTGLSLLNFTWAQTPTSLNPYIGTTVTKLNPGQTYEYDKQTTQTLDQYGNLLTMQAYNFGNGSVGSLARTYTNTYLGGTNYTSRYIFNRLLTSTVTDGTNTATLASNVYDGTTPYCPTPGPGNPGGCTEPPCNSIQVGQTNLCEHDNVNYPPSFNYRGNLTGSTTPTTTTTNAYDTFGTGTVTSTTVNGVTSTVGTTNNFAAPGAIATNSLLSSMNWNSFLGLSSATGPNGDTGSISYDANARPTSVTSPYGAITNYTYNDTASPPNKVSMTGTQGAETIMDGFGRTIKTITGSGATQGSTTISTVLSTVDVQYAPCGCSPLGKLSQQSQPYAPGGTDAWTVYSYDASGRTTSVVLPDGSTTTYQYYGTTVDVWDAAGNLKMFTMDAFGNLVTAYEQDPALGTVWTNYGYDVLNHLTSVYMGRGSNAQSRAFNYNSSTTVTGLLQSATNPENGTVTYTYNANNLLATKTDALSNKLTYAYDGYNRLTSVTLGASQVLRTYYYDTNPLDSTGMFSQNPLGRLTAVKYPTEGNTTVQLNDMYSYNEAGLPVTKRLQVNEPVKYDNANGQPQSATLTFNLDSAFNYNGLGAIASITYPSTGASSAPTAGPSYNYSFDSMNRLSGMTTSTGTTVVNNVSYNAANRLLTIDYPSGNETRAYNTLNQLIGLSVQATNGSYPVSLTYNYPTGTNIGKVSSMYNAVSGETITYTYDSLKRLVTANGSGWGQQYGYDSFGNLLSKTVTAGSGPSLSQAVNTANNQIVGDSYDANGNTLSVSNDGVTDALSYDAENRLSYLTPNGGTTYVSYGYDAQNRRIWSSTGAKDTYGNPTNYTLYVYSPRGQMLGLYGVATALSSSQQNLEVTGGGIQYFGGHRLAPMDQLGSAVSYTAPVTSYFPWGETKGTYNPQDSFNFATYWQDSATGLDYANNRYYSNAYGRFMTPDPSWRSVNLKNPQTWNRYAYVVGDPVNSNDPSGLDGFDDGDGDVCDYDPYLAECAGPSNPYGGTALPPAPASSYPSPPTSVTVPINAGPGLTGSLDINLTNGSMSFQFADAQDGAIVIGACVAQPELCVFIGGSILTIYVVTTYGPALWEAIQSQITSRQAAPVSYSPYNAGRDSNGNCNKPDPSKFVKWQGTGGDHWHWITWNQNPADCMTYPDYQSGPNDPGPQYTEIPR